MKKMKTNLTILIVSVALMGCTTVKDLEEVNNTFTEESTQKNLAAEETQNQEEMNEYLVSEQLKVQDIENTVIYVDRPVYIPNEPAQSWTDRKQVKGYDAVVASQKAALVKPENYSMGTFWYQYNENLVYEIYAQPYHLTDIILEAGEVVIGVPKLSEDESVWELTADVGKDASTGLDVQHLYIKPAYSKLDSTLIVVTDRRVYHLRLKSFSNTHMAMVRFSYPQQNRWIENKSQTQGRSIENNYIHITNPENISLDYKIKYSVFKTPEFLPKVVYDDGQMTYIQVDTSVLQKKLPLIFNEKNEIVNYSVEKNVFILPRLINKITLRLGNQKVTIEKKVKKQSKAEVE